ncbi:ankyrin repeat domain-containing protein 54 [Cylas formicarius]|uniref:ankyrin repeat domain-containing protein 54 n=1 Tax=Cylas formicarius TaxID=197179 RepID=UPI00295866B7|nr:ankyrin repeat domain-containing protein 54 [Cylas formicarius]
MSHSDSEIRDTIKKRKQFDPKLKFKALAKYNKRQLRFEGALKHRLEPIYYELRLIRAVNTYNTEQVKKLLENGVSPNSTDYEGRSALHIAVSKGYADVVQLLLGYGADPNKRDILQNTPLHLAACVHNLPIISMLLNAKADASSLDIHGRNPLQLASSKLDILRRSWREGSIEMVKLRAELVQVIDLLLSFFMREAEDRSERVDMNRANVNELQLIKLSLNSSPVELLDNQMTKLLNDIEKIQIK